MTIATENQIEDFIRAVRANNYAHIELQEDMALVTDFNSAEEFYPYVTIESDDIEKSDIKEELDELDFIEYHNVDIQSQAGVSIDYGEIERAEFVDPIRGDDDE